ncbi:hypothetical protein SERLA73DRAFT_122389 [Serpula lacrymans var. lacrymans S7.3]|uniref:Uncharacterized protein n=2 Tax=Serpula lacrymans var. lacrymans TaxID=341189 RepID=F8PWN1_SERL3|nr:uncharacterized protein SERLADRAFT_388604 [Serpula lacrymans var. lacrymans S7.9]EGO00355.1 hypothetical protein SERLA73DRAFT_122389 [Serpula lacrymans var. lacrymans S7.3]EGO25916.1 hypothetical protein SERLADRAFT_388604 [Serpula lacrymans var. lacrymans S7.9]
MAYVFRRRVMPYLEIEGQNTALVAAYSLAMPAAVLLLTKHNAEVSASVSTAASRS